MSRPRRFCAGVALALALGAWGPASIEAQLSRADSAAVLLDTAKRFEEEGRREIAEALYVHIAERFADTPAAATARARLAAPEGQRVERTSRVELQVFGGLYGLWLGLAVPVATDAESAEAVGAGLLLGGPAGLLAGRAYLRANPVTEGQARAVSWGGIWGTWQGLGWTEVLELGIDEVCGSFGCFPEGTEEELFTGAIVGGLAGVVTGALIARRPVRSGVASGAQFGSTWGSIHGALAAVVAGSDGGEPTLVTSLLVGNAGLMAGAALARRYGMSRSRIRLLDVGALVGGVGGVGLALLADTDDERVAAGLTLVGSIAGVVAATALTRDRDRVGEPAPGGALGSALLDYRDGALVLQTPLPMPAAIPALDARGRETWRPGIRVTLLDARF